MVNNDKLLHNKAFWMAAHGVQRTTQKLTDTRLLTAIVSEKFLSLSLLLRTPPMLKNVGFSPLLGFCSRTQLWKVNRINVHK